MNKTRSNKIQSVYIIAGEKSGDMIGAGIIDEIKKINSDVKITGVGGPEMSKRNFVSFFPMNKISLMGFFEILPHIFYLKKLIKQTVDDIINKKPDVVVTIDSPGFCYRVVSLLKKLHPEIYTIHIVAPSVWAYKPSRAKKFAKIYDHMLTLFSFEPPFFHKENMEATCIGHPVFEQKFGNGNKFRKAHGISDNTKIIVVTPGSRHGELTRHLPVFIPALELLVQSSSTPIIICFVMNYGVEILEYYLQKVTFKYLIINDEKERLQAYAAGNLALAKSGTNTLEIAASKVPMIVGYKMNILTFLIVKMMIKVRYASIINIIADKEIIPEFLQSNCNVMNLFLGMQKILNNKQAHDKQIKNATEILYQIGYKSGNTPSHNAAKVILGLDDNI